MKVKENIPTIPNYIIKKQNRILLITLFCIFAVFQSGLRDIKTLPSYNDTPNYVRKYQEASRASWEMLFKNFSFYSSDYGERDLGYPIFIKMTQAIYNDFTFFMFLTAFIFIVPFGMLIYKYVKSFWGIILSFLIYSLSFKEFDYHLSETLFKDNVMFIFWVWLYAFLMLFACFYLQLSISQHYSCLQRP